MSATTWKTTTLALAAFSAGMVYATACGGSARSPMDARATDRSTPPPPDTAGDLDLGGGTVVHVQGARAVVELLFDAAGNRCLSEEPSGDVPELGCDCPDGFTFVGFAQSGSHAVCLEDAAEW